MAVRNAAVQLVDHAELAQELRLHRALAARQHKCVERLTNVGPLSQFHAFASQLRKRALVFDKRPLNSQDGYFLSHMKTFQAISGVRGGLLAALGHEKGDLVPR